MDDDKIVELYLSRNEEAIVQTAQKYGSRLRNIAYNILDDRETAKECENDAYHETWKLIPPNEPRDYLFAFVGRIVRHIALNICKMNKRQKRYAVYCKKSTVHFIGSRNLCIIFDIIIKYVQET